MRAALLVLLVAATAGAAEIQTAGQQRFPGKLQAGVHPVGFQVGWSGLETSGYKLNADFSGLIHGTDKVSLWLGGGFNYTAGLFRCVGLFCGHDLQFWAFLEASFEKLIDFPIVPFARAGLGGDVLIYNAIGGAFVVRVGGGAHYWILKNIGLGAETYLTMGPGFYGTGLGFYGAWDFTLGARFAF